MAEIGEILSDEELKSKAAAVGAGILVIIAGFLVYNYFSKVGKSTGVVEEGATTEQQTQEKKATTEEKKSEQQATKEKTSKPEKAPETGQEKQPQATTAWSANNYNPGDISGNSYTVKKGDTLWEIAEARYGSGFDWVKIRDANKDRIGFLPNGQQSLITPGQTLELP